MPAKLPKTFTVNSQGRVEAPAPEPEPEKKPAAAEPAKCSECQADLPAGAKFCPQCGAQVPEPEGDDTPAAEARAFSRFAMTLTNTTSIEGARGALHAWKGMVDRGQSLESQLAEKTSQLAFIQRERLVERAVAEGRLDPSEAWSFSTNDKGEKVRAFSAWAGPPNAAGTQGQTLEQLTAFVAARPAKSAARPLTPGDKPESKASAPSGYKPDIYAAASRQVSAQCGGK